MTFNTRHNYVKLGCYTKGLCNTTNLVVTVKKMIHSSPPPPPSSIRWIQKTILQFQFDILVFLVLFLGGWLEEPRPWFMSILKSLRHHLSLTLSHLAYVQSSLVPNIWANQMSIKIASVWDHVFMPTGWVCNLILSFNDLSQRLHQNLAANIQIDDQECNV